jgi:dTDP-4-dehydrorhamnose 3,5-epimerase-like enzyme
MKTPEHSLYGLDDCVVVDLPKINDARGNLTFVEGERHVPFEIRRVFYLYDVPTAESRGAHAHREQHQFLICLSGSFDVELDDGLLRRTVHLNRPWKGLHIPPTIWAAEVNFDPHSICLVLASDVYKEADYIRGYPEFLAARAGNTHAHITGPLPD